MIQQNDDPIIIDGKNDQKTFEIISTYPLIIVKYGDDFAVAFSEAPLFKKALLENSTGISIAESYERPISTDNYVGQTTLPDEKVGLFNIGYGSPQKFFIITNYGYFHSGYIGPFIKDDQYLTTRWIEKASTSEIIFHQRTHYLESPSPVLDYCRLKLFPPSEPAPLKVPKLFIDIAASVLKQDQHAFQKLCKEYIDEMAQKDQKIQRLERELFMYEAIAIF